MHCVLSTNGLKSSSGFFVRTYVQDFTSYLSCMTNWLNALDTDFINYFATDYDADDLIELLDCVLLPSLASQPPLTL